MANTFTVTIPQTTNVATALGQVAAGIQEQGGTFQGDDKQGAFAVKGVQGSYTIAGRACTITIEKKPFIVSHAYVEKAIRGYFA